MTPTFKKEEILQLLKVLVQSIEQETIDPTYSNIEEHYNLFCDEDGRKFTMIFKLKPIEGI